VAEPTFDELTSAVAGGIDAFCSRVEALAGDDFDKRTRCAGWRVRDLAWHLAWGEGPGEVIRAAREGAEPPEYATSRMGPTPTDQEIVAAAREKAPTVRREMEALTSDEEDMLVRYGSGDAGRSLSEYLWAYMCEVAVHSDDLATSLGIDEPLDASIAGELVRRRVRGAVGWASKDGLQPVAPRGYRLTGDNLDCGFFFRDGSWHEGIDASVPTCTFAGGNTTLLRLVMGRIPVSLWEASANRPWDDGLRLSGEIDVASPIDFMRWCYGAW
jgi:uncharacterized protein (TIGR03083 family)